MKSFKKHINEGKNDGGDCFIKANEIVLNFILPVDGSKESDYKIVHALVYGQGPLRGRRFVHAFILFDDKLVIDNSNGSEIVMMKHSYYNAGRIDEKEKGAYQEYTIDQARRKMISIGTHGPWDIDLSLEENFKRMGKYDQKITPEEKKILKGI